MSVCPYEAFLNVVISIVNKCIHACDDRSPLSEYWPPRPPKATVNTINSRYRTGETGANPQHTVMTIDFLSFFHKCLAFSFIYRQSASSPLNFQIVLYIKKNLNSMFLNCHFVRDNVYIDCVQRTTVIADHTVYCAIRGVSITLHYITLRWL